MPRRGSATVPFWFVRIKRFIFGNGFDILWCQVFLFPLSNSQAPCFTVVYLTHFRGASGVVRKSVGNPNFGRSVFGSIESDVCNHIFIFSASIFFEIYKMCSVCCCFLLLLRFLALLLFLLLWWLLFLFFVLPSKRLSALWFRDVQDLPKFAYLDFVRMSSHFFGAPFICFETFAECWLLVLHSSVIF